MLNQDDFASISRCAEESWPNKDAILRKIIASLGGENFLRAYPMLCMLVVTRIAVAADRATSPKELMRLLTEMTFEGYPFTRLFDLSPVAA